MWRCLYVYMSGTIVKLPDSSSSAGRKTVLAAAMLLALLAGVVLPSYFLDVGTVPIATATSGSTTKPPPPGMEALARLRAHAARTPTAEEIVAKKLTLFAKKHRAIVHKIADYHHLAVPSDVDRFFAAVEAGNWDEAHRIYHLLRGGDQQQPGNGSGSEDLRPFWRPILEAYGAAQQAHLWPAQQLLDYGNSILGSLEPGMVYVGGTDPGCFIPTMLNETSDGGQHIVFTQNALADSTYLDYLRFIYGDQFNTPTAADALNAFDQYLADAQQRLDHDTQSPNEPKQVLPDENFIVANGAITGATGATAEMGINDLIMQKFLEQNPDLSVAMESSFPLKVTEAGAVPFGSIMELGVNDGAGAITADTAAQTSGYWDSIADNLLSNPDTAGSDAVMKTYAHDAVAAANLLANNNYPDAAEQTYQTALDLWPDSMEAVTGYASVLANQGQIDQANAMLDSFLLNNPSQASGIAALRNTFAPAPGSPALAPRH
jgi:tetratricopeptide (TPR) repeat protein